MLQFSVPAGRWFGVQLRAHVSLLFLLCLAAGFSMVATGSALRGVALWMDLLLAVLVRQIVCALAAVYRGLELRGLLLLPVGGVMSLAPRRDGGMPIPPDRTISFLGSAANVAVAGLLLGFSYGVDPGVRLFSQPWISTGHLLRSAVWLQVLVAAVNFLPATATPVRRRAAAVAAASPRPVVAAVPSTQRVRAAFGFGTAIGLGLLLAGLVSGMLWPVLLGITLLFTSYLYRTVSTGSTEVLAARVQDVMLTEYKALSASSTLRDALRQTTHTVQDIFPVLRGERLVGWISRQRLLNHLSSTGDGFLQGAMLRSFQTASPAEPLGEALRHASANGAAEFIPVIQDGAMVGLLTPSSLERSVQQLRLTHTPPEQDR